ncbi:MAG TPA: hypothetical protein VEC16_05040 [Alphaproteobacteria bacterium]|nr:hypothetical protein [Alphaproteobacteria bacterium]
MGSLDKLLEDPKYKEYKLLKNYVLYRDSGYSKYGELKQVKIYPETIEQYIKAYEFLSGENLRARYINQRKIINTRKEKVTFSSKRSDGIKVSLFCHAEAMELLLTAKNDDTDKSLYSISTIIGEYNAPNTYAVLYTALTRAGIKIECESLKIPTIIKEKIVDHKYGRIGIGLFPKISDQ